MSRTYLFKENGKSPSVASVERFYQQLGIADIVNFDHIKRHYYMTHTEINPTRIVPIGPAHKRP